MNRFAVLFAVAVPALTACAAEVGDEADSRASVAALCPDVIPNPDAFPNGYVPVQISRCTFDQYYTTASAPDVDYGECGFTALFGPQSGKLRPARHIFDAEWSSPPTTREACLAANTEVHVFGYLCENAACSLGAWKQIGAKGRSGSWNAATQHCNTRVRISDRNADYQTVGLSAHTDSDDGTPASGSFQIWVSKPTGECLTADGTPEGAGGSPKEAEETLEVAEPRRR